MQGNTLLTYGNYRSLKASATIMSISLIAYLLHHPRNGAYGGTWLGYVFGISGFLFLIYLLWYAVYKRYLPGNLERRRARDYSSFSINTQLNRRKRNSKRRDFLTSLASSRQGWLSAHIYFGLSVVVIISLHTGFHFGANVHTAAYVLLMGVVLTGLYGVYAYTRFPVLIADNLGGDTLETLFQQISKLSKYAISISHELPSVYLESIRYALAEPRIGGGLVEQLNLFRRKCPILDVTNHVLHMGEDIDEHQETVHRELCYTLFKLESLVRRARTDITLRAKLNIWLYFHIPLAITLMIAVLSHVLSIVIYW